MGLHGVSLICIALLPIVSILAMIFRDIDHNEFASESDPIIETNNLKYLNIKEEIKMMGIGTFEEMVTESKESLKKALIAEANVIKTALDLCTNEFEEQTMIENFREVFKETMEELKES